MGFSSQALRLESKALKHSQARQVIHISEVGKVGLGWTWTVDGLSWGKRAASTAQMLFTVAEQD